MPDNPDLGPTAAIITIGDEIVEGRVLNKNATWLADELMARGVWPRVVVAVPDVSPCRIAVAAATFPIDAVPVKGITGGVPVDGEPIHRTTITLDTTEDQIAETLKQFGSEHPLVRLGSYPDLDSHPPQVTLVLVSRSPSSLDEAATWLTNQLMRS